MPLACSFASGSPGFSVQWRGQRRTVIAGRAEQLAAGAGALEVEVRVVLPGEPDPAVQLDGLGGAPVVGIGAGDAGDAGHAAEVAAAGRRLSCRVGRGPG